MRTGLRAANKSIHDIYSRRHGRLPLLRIAAAALIAVALVFAVAPACLSAHAEEAPPQEPGSGGETPPGESGETPGGDPGETPGDPGETPGGDPGEPPGEDPEFIDRLYLRNAEPDSLGLYHFVGEDSDKNYKTLNISVTGRKIQLNGYYTTGRSDGGMYETANTASPLGSVALEWSSSDEDVATVDPYGEITPKGDGETTITAAVAETEAEKYDGKAPSKSVKLKISGQTAEYVKSVEIIDGNGNKLSRSDDVTTVVDGKNKFYQFYARITWYSPAEDTERVEDTRKNSVTSTISWTIGGSSVVGAINGDTGRFKSSEYSGNCFVQCAVTGGVDGKTMTDIAIVQVDTGEYAYKPASSLTLKVVYQEFPDRVVQEHTYPLDGLAGSLPSYTHSYTVLAGTRYGTIRARGYLFKDVLALEGVEIDEVYQFRFTTADGYDNPITSKLLFGSGSRYYFPNWDIGGSRSGAVVVPPLLAYESNMMWNQPFVDPSAPLDDANRFRLVFGPLWSGETNSSFQIYYIGAITIVLNGAPPADNGEGEGNDPGDGKDKSENKGEDKKNEAAVVSVKPKDGNGNGNGAGGVAGGKGGAGVGSAGAGDNAGAGDGPKSAGDGAAADGASGDIGKALSGPDGANDVQRRTGGDWKVYEMISNAKSNVAPLDMDLPYLGVAAPIACSGVAAGGLTFFIGFRRRLY